ncbi:MAG: hypothetical protein IPM16_10600 [Chloroflexi bacterium]|nr:hypothetical protein [Chloroflexota bacterium]
MQTAPPRSAFGEVTDFLATNPTPEEILAYTLSDSLQARAEELLELHGEGQLTPEQHDEMMDLVRIDTILQLLKAKTKRRLQAASE